MEPKMELEKLREVLKEYLDDMGLERQDHIFIKKVKNHIKIGKVAFRCIE